MEKVIFLSRLMPFVLCAVLSALVAAATVTVLQPQGADAAGADTTFLRSIDRGVSQTNVKLDALRRDVATLCRATSAKSYNCP